MAAASRRSSRLVRRSMAAISRRGLQFVRRASAGSVVGVSIFAAGEASAQITLPPNLSIGVETTTPGLLEGRAAGAFNLTAPNGGERGFKLEPIVAQTPTTTPVEPWLQDTTHIYTGEMLFPDNGTAGDGISEFAFVEHVDDSTQIRIDGVVLLNNTVWNAVNTTGRRTISAGWHDVEFRFGQGGGGGGPSTNTDADADPNNPWDTTLGFGVDFVSPIEGDLKQPTYQRPVDNGTGNVFRLRTYNIDTSRDNQNVNVTADASLTILQGRVVPFGSLTVANNVNFTVDSRTTATFTQTNIPAVSTFNVLDGVAVTGPLLSPAAVTSLTKTGAGELNVSTAAGSNVTSIGAVNVNGGTLAVGVSGATTSVGTGPINLSSGTLALGNDLAVANGPGVFNTTGSFYQNGFEVTFTPNANGGWTALDSKAAFDTTIASYVDPATTLATMPINVRLDWPNGPLTDGGTNDGTGVVFDNIPVPGSLSGNATDMWVARFVGKLNVTTAGPTEFIVGSNDGAVLFLDTDLGPGTNWQKVADNNRSWQAGAVGEFEERGTGITGTLPTITQLPAQNLSVGVYDYVVGMYNTTAAPDNDEGGLEVSWVPAGGTRSIIPFAAGGPVTLNNVLTVSGNSGLDVRAPSATLAGLRMNPGSSLTVSGNPLTTSITATGAGTVTIGSAGATVNLTTLHDGGNAVNFSAAPGTVLLTRTGGPGPDLGATSSVGAGPGGRLVATSDATTNTLGGAPVTLTGGTLELRTGSVDIVKEHVGDAAFTGTFVEDVIDPGTTAGSNYLIFQDQTSTSFTLATTPLIGALARAPINAIEIVSGTNRIPIKFGANQSDGGAAGGGDDGNSQVTGAAGVLGTASWNNFGAQNEPAPQALNLSTASPSGASVTWSANGLWSSTGQGEENNTAPAGENRDLMAGYLDTGAINEPGVTINIANLPASFTSGTGYDVYVYVKGGVNGRGGNYTMRVAAAQMPNFASNVHATENSTIQVTGPSAAQLGSLSAAAGKTLTVSGNLLRVGGSLGGAGTIQGAASSTVEFVGTAPSSGTPSLDIETAATMRFAPGSGNTFGGSAVTAVTNDGLLHAASGVTDLSSAIVTQPIPTGTVLVPGLSGVTGRFYNTGFTLDQSHTAGRTDPAVNGWSGLASVTALDAVLTPLTPQFNVPINVPLNFPGSPLDLATGGNDDEAGNIFAASNIGVNLGNVQDINFVVRFGGKLNVSQAGPTAFTLTNNDGAAMFVDLDQGPGTNWTLVADNNRYAVADGNVPTRGTNQPGTPAITQPAAPNLATGQYDFVVGWFNNNLPAPGLPEDANGESGIEVRWTPAGGTQTIIPQAQIAAPSEVRVDSGATLRLGALRGPNLNMAPTSRLELHSATSRLAASALQIPGAPGAWTATVDMTDEDMVIDSSAATKTADFNRMYDQLKSGFAGGVWTGTGITSSTAATNPTADTGLSLVDNALLGATTFSGQTVNADSILLKYTYYGDIDMNGQVDGDDLTTFALNFGQTSGMTQVDGDIDFNGRVDGEDLTVFALNFNKGIGNPLAAGSVAAVPEPSTILLAGLAAAGLAAAGVFRKRRRS